MNQTSKEIVDKITASLVMPSVGMTLTQEEADAIKEHVRVRLEENIQGAVHSGFFRFNMSGYKRPGMINREREAEIRREARKRCLDEIEALSKNESIESGVGSDVEKVYYLAILSKNEKKELTLDQYVTIARIAEEAIEAEEKIYGDKHTRKSGNGYVYIGRLIYERCFPVVHEEYK